ncbi:MAG: GDP-mannose 4,6-dehydratase [Leptospirales bacterium]|nr:GDP-mannose 4,6-dehydratase [Leptospirales bacterium]
MKHALITGSRGFVGTHLARHLLNEGYRVSGLDRPGSGQVRPRWLSAIYSDLNKSVESIDSTMEDCKSLGKIFASNNFDAVFHLAGTAFVPEGWKDPAGVIENNTVVPVRLFQAARDNGFKGTIVFASSGEVYGVKGTMPILESQPVAPGNPYAESKRAAEQFIPYFCEQGMRIVIARPFNHIGPGQRENFVVPSFLARIAEAQSQNKSSISVGDLESERDFADVRDVAQAYQILAERGESGEIYNICSGQPVPIRRVLDLAIEVTGSKIVPVTDPALLRPDGRSIRFGSSSKLNALGWKQRYSLKQSVQDTWKAMQA